jgi:hypothetical protein
MTEHGLPVDTDAIQRLGIEAHETTAYREAALLSLLEL